MKRRLFLGGIAVLAGLTFAGCSTVSDSRADRGTGVAASYAAPFEEGKLTSNPITLFL